VDQLNAAIAAGKPGDAVEIFMVKAIGIPEEYVAGMRHAPPPQVTDENAAMQPPAWSDMEAVAHTLAYDGMIMGGTMRGKPLPQGKWSGVTARTLVITGGNSEGFFHSGAKALAAQLDNAEYRVLEGQDHAVAPAALAPVLKEFFGR
jgi:pimeloyl-ACP methyl ester carboxylesterase